MRSYVQIVFFTNIDISTSNIFFIEITNNVKLINQFSEQYIQSVSYKRIFHLVVLLVSSFNKNSRLPCLDVKMAIFNRSSGYSVGTIATGCKISNWLVL